MTKIFSIFVFLFSILNFVYGQQEKRTDDLSDKRIFNGDTIHQIDFEEIVVLPPHQFKNRREEIRYTRLILNIKKVLPYAKIAKQKLDIINNDVAKLKTKQEKNEYLKLAEKSLKNDFEKEITGLTISQGKLLIKLIDRETGVTSYNLIKELKGSFNAFLYQSIARLFGENLKDEYDPKGDDRLIEEIVIRVENGEL